MSYPVLVRPGKLKVQPNGFSLYIQKGNQVFVSGINESAFSILRLCNGINSIDEIVEELVIKYSEKKKVVFGFVKDFLEQSTQFGTIEWIPRQYNFPIKVIGSPDFWTPDLIHLDLTYDCLLSCKHCYLDAGKEKNSALYQMNREILDELCKQIIDLQIDRIQLSGGEPLIYPEIESIIENLYNVGVYVIIVTSGIYCNERIYDSLKLLANNNGKIQVSLDGFENTHNQIRGNNNSFQKAISFIQKMLSFGVEVDVSTSLFEQSFEEIEELCGYFKSIGIRRHRISLIVEKGRAIINDITVSNDFLIKFNHFINKLKDKYNTDFFQVTTEEDLLENIDKHTTVHCGAGFRMLRVSPDFNVYPCALIDYSNDNLKNISLIDYIKKYSNHFAKIEPPSEKYCSNCNSYSLCKLCIAQGMIRKEKENKCNWFESQGNSFSGLAQI